MVLGFRKAWSNEGNSVNNYNHVTRLKQMGGNTNSWVVPLPGHRGVGLLFHHKASEACSLVSLPPSDQYFLRQGLAQAICVLPSQSQVNCEILSRALRHEDLCPPSTSFWPEQYLWLSANPHNPKQVQGQSRPSYPPEQGLATRSVWERGSVWTSGWQTSL